MDGTQFDGTVSIGAAFDDGRWRNLRVSEVALQSGLRITGLALEEFETTMGQIGLDYLDLQFLGQPGIIATAVGQDLLIAHPLDALHGGGLLSAPLDSGGLMSYGDPGWRDWILDEQAAHPFVVRAAEAAGHRRTLGAMATVFRTHEVTNQPPPSCQRSTLTSLIIPWSRPSTVL